MARVDALEDIAACDFGSSGVNLRGGDRPEPVKGIHVSADYLRLFGAPMAWAARSGTMKTARTAGASW